MNHFIDVGSHLGVTRTYNESSFNSKEYITMKSSTMDLTIDTTRTILKQSLTKSSIRPRPIASHIKNIF